MFVEEQQYTCVNTSIRIKDVPTTVSPRFNSLEQLAQPVDNTGRLFSLVRNAPESFAERFPHLMVGVVAFAVLLAALTAEIDCLRGSGYYWQ